jgi:hypothetical protein
MSKIKINGKVNQMKKNSNTMQILRKRYNDRMKTFKYEYNNRIVIKIIIYNCKKYL